MRQSLIFLNQITPDGQTIHAGSKKCPERVSRAAHYRFAGNIETGIDYYRHSRNFPEIINQMPISGIGSFAYRLHSHGMIQMRSGNYFIFFIFGLEGFPSIDLLPSALGPISSLPWNHPTILLSANFLAASLQTSSHFLHLATLHSLIKGSISSLEYSGPQ